MPDDAHWQSVLANINGTTPVDIDDDLPVRPKPKSDLSNPDPDDRLPPSRKLFPKQDASLAFIGVRVNEPLSNPSLLATRLAASALERGVIPIILTKMDQSGLERFGFRTERVIDDPGSERDLAAFWDMAIIIDASDVERLG